MVFEQNSVQRSSLHDLRDKGNLPVVTLGLYKSGVYISGQCFILYFGMKNCRDELDIKHM